MSDEIREEDLAARARNADAEAMTELGKLLEARGDISGAECWLLRAAESDDAAVRRLGNLYFNSGSMELAELWYRKGAELGYISSMFNLGAVLAARGESDEAEEWYLKAAEEDSPSAMTNLAILYEERGDMEIAETWYKRAVELRYPQAMFNLGIFYAERGEKESAFRLYEEGARLGDAPAMYNYGSALFDDGRVSEAEDWLKKALDLGYENAIVGLGIVLQNQGNFDAAEQWFQRAVDEGVPTGPTSLDALHRAIDSEKLLDGVTFETFGWPKVKSLENFRGWSGGDATLTERYFDFPPDFQIWDAEDIRRSMINLQEYIVSPTFDVGDEDLPEQVRGLFDKDVLEQTTLIDVECFLVEGVKSVLMVNRHRARGEIHFSASIFILFSMCFWLLALELEEEELVGLRESAVAHLVLEQNETSDIRFETFDPYNEQWDGIVPIESDPLACIRFLATDLRKSIRLRGDLLELEPFSG